MTGHDATLPDRFYPTGLAADMIYRVRLVWPQDWRAVSGPSVVDALDLLGDGALLSGDALMTVGMQLPLTLPQTVLLLHLQAES